MVRASAADEEHLEILERVVLLGVPHDDAPAVDRTSGYHASELGGEEIVPAHPMVNAESGPIGCGQVTYAANL
jgi:hypothetical protein